MASVVASSAVFAPYAFAAATPSSAPETYSTQSFVGLKSAGVFAGKSASLRSKLKAVSNGSRVQCMQVWSPINNLKFETLSYLPPLTSDQISKQIDYMLANKWIPCLEFHPVGVIFRKYHKSPGYYDGRYWTMWKLPMFGCTDSALVLQEIELVKEEYPNCYVRVLGFDNTRQVQCVSFIVHKPSSPPPTQLGRQVRSREGPAAVPAAQQSVNLPAIAQLPLSAPVFRPPASSLIAKDLTLDWDSLDIVGKYAEQLVYPRRPEPNPPPQAGSSREERWLRMQAAASELSGLSRVIATNTVAHELYIQELEDIISLLRLISTRHKAYLQSAAEQSSSAVNVPKHTSQPPTDLDRQVRPWEGPSAVPAPQQSVDLPPIATPSTSSSIAVIPIQDGVEGEEESTGSVNTTAVGEDEVLQGTEVGVTGKVPDPQGQILDSEGVDVDPPAPLAELEPGSWTVLDHYVLMVGGALALLPMAMLLHLVTADHWPHWRHDLVNVVGTFGSADH